MSLNRWNRKSCPDGASSLAKKAALAAMLLAGGLLLGGCQAGGKKVVHSPAGGAEMASERATAKKGAGDEFLSQEDGAGPVFLANIDSGRFDPFFVKSRLQIYGDKAGEWQDLTREIGVLGLSHQQEAQWQQCVGLLEDLVSGYQDVLAGAGDPLAVTRKDISFAESDCEKMFAVHATRVPELLARYQQEAAGQAMAIIDHYALRKEYPQVIAAYENAVEFSGKPPADLRLQEIYGRALLHTGQLEKAADIFSQVLTEGGPTEKWPLRLEVAELFMASGQYEKARSEYLHLADIFTSWKESNQTVTDNLALLFAAEEHGRELALYSQALRSFLSSAGHGIPRALESAVAELQTTYPGGMHTAAAEELYQKAEEQMRQHTDVRLARVERLSAAREYKEALDLLAGLRQSRLSAAEMARVEEAILTVQGAQELFLRMGQVQRKENMADQWQEGLNLLDMELYDDAIALFTDLLGTDYDARAAAEIEKASLQAARALRSEAAALFMRAGRASDPALRRTLLNESRELLLSILARYPRVEIVDKVEVNLQVIDEHLLALKQR